MCSGTENTGNEKASGTELKRAEGFCGI